MISRDNSPDLLFRLYREHGDAKALGEVFDLVAPELLTVAVHITRCPDRAEDLVQSVFLRAMEKRSQWRSDRPLQPWFMELLAEEMVEAKHVETHSIQTEELDEVELIPRRRDPVGQALLVEMDERLQGTLEQLPDRYREVVRLSFQEGRNSQEIGMLLKRSPATVRSQLARGLDRMRQLLPGTLGLSILCSSAGVGADAGLLWSELRRRVLDKAPVSLTPVAKSAGASTPAMAAKWVAATLICVAAIASWNRWGTEGLALAHSTVEAGLGESADARLASSTLEIESFAATPVRIPIAVAKVLEAQGIHVFGQVVGPDGNPLAGAKVRLFSMGRWSDRAEDTTLDVTGDGWDTRTDEAGTFSFAVPLPAHYAPGLRIEAGPRYTRALRWFASAHDHLGPIQSGENPVGVIRLQGAGDLSGQVLAHDGSPAYPARVALTPGKDPRIGSIVSTEPDGSFEATGLIAGYQKVEVFHAGQRILREGVLVRAGQRNFGLNLEFSEPSPLRVHVTDARGNGLGNVEMRFASQAQRWGLLDENQSTDSAGWATLFVPSGGSQELVATAVGHSAEQAAYTLLPGQEWLEIRMVNLPMQEVQVINAQTGRSLPDCSLRVEELKSGDWTERGLAHIGKSDGGSYVVAGLLPGQRLRVAHEGYRWGHVEASAFGEGPLRVALKPIKSIRCRILLEGLPQAAVRVEICAGSFSLGVTPESQSKRLHFKGFPAQYAWSRSDSEGQLESEAFSVESNEYCLRAKFGDGWALEHWFTLPDDDRAVVDLGDLHFEPAGSIRGTIATPEGMTPAGLTVLLDTFHGSEIASVNALGEFSFKGVTPGPHLLRIGARLGLDIERASFLVSTKAGEVSGASIDLRPRGLSYRQLKLTEKGQPLVGARVFLRSAGSGRAFCFAGFLGFTDDQGLVQGELPVGGFTEVWFEPEGGGVARKHPSAKVELSVRLEPVLVVDF